MTAPGNKVAVSVAAATPAEQIGLVREAAGLAALAEVRLDLATRIDPELLVRRSPLPLIVTCRPVREGGAFTGSERERLGVLTAATRAGAAFVDVEWSSRARFAPARGARTRVIVSRHFRGMPRSLLASYRALRRMGDAVKLVGVATRATDMLPVLQLLHRARTPVIALAMGTAGQLTRLIAPVFDAALLTYGAPDADRLTAPGQLTVIEMCRHYQLHRAVPRMAVHVHLAGAAPRSSRGALHVALAAAPPDARRIAAAIARSGATVQLHPGGTRT
ncbi:MAG TPA: type I 3-dehydroquinate dehydratase [Kofleriaceae bacterium]|jgi:3-dehydroquinate dehydratase/shikimate dehydrogenase|nr:type I 3-dehydroquinate dehydratase [Kofleriaceae bacterium]